MSESPAVADHGHDHHDDDPWSHVPPPSFWPFGVGLGLVAMFVAAVLWIFAITPNPAAEKPQWILDLAPYTPYMVLGGTVLMLFPLMGWAHQIIKEKVIAHDLLGQQVDLKMFTKMFLIGELSAFGAIFGYFYVRRLTTDTFHAPDHIHLGGFLVAFATFLLLTSSVTCEMAHHALAHGNKAKARVLLLATLVLGLIFLGFQGYEYGELYQHHFTMETSAYSSVFYISTGFHGLHVLTGLVMLFLVWIRMEMGHYTKDRHYSFIAASWYWHFVDIVWILLFITVYVV